MTDDDLSRARERRERRRTTAPVGAFGPSSRKQVVINRVMLQVEDKARQNGNPTPERITQALNLRGLYGPEVDEACGVMEPAVDEWEVGTRIPTRQQVQALARLTDFPVAFFYQPAPEPLGPLWLCGPSGCEVIQPEASEPIAPVDQPTTLF